MSNSSMVRLGWALSAVTVAVLLADAAVALLAPGKLAAEMQETGFPPAQIATVGVITLVSVLMYAIPRTAVFGAVLITGFAGGAICTHLRLGEIGSPPQLICLLIAAAAWGGIYLREPRLRALLPLRG